MSHDTLQTLIAMIGYMAVVIGIGLYFAKRANQSSEDYFLGGRSLGPWVAAMSAEASDMSGWLLMGLPGVAYWCGLSDAVWTAIGLALGTYINWLIVAKRLRHYSFIARDAITVPDFFSNRFHEKKKVIMTIAAMFILIFFTVYAASCFVTCGKLFSTLFGLSYRSMMIAGAIFVVIYTFLGGFLADRRLRGRGRLWRGGGKRQSHPRLFHLLRHRQPHGGCFGRAAGGKRRAPLWRCGFLRLAHHHLHHVLGPRLFRHAAGFAALHGHS